MKRMLHAALLGFVAATMLVQPVAAQWQVYDPAVWKQLWVHSFDEKVRWTERVKYFVDAAQKSLKMVQQGAEQVSSLSGILDLAERSMLKDEKLAREFADMGQTVRDIFALQRQIQRFVYHDIAGLRDIWTRMEGGIFDPAANRRDLEQYLRHAIGTTVREFFLNQEQLAASDLELARWFDELLNIEGQIAFAKKDRDGILVQLEDNREKGMEPVARAALYAKFDDIQKRIDDLEKEHGERLSRISERYRRYHLLVGSRTDSAVGILKDSKGWNTFLDLKTEAQRMINEENMAFEGKTPPPHE